MVAKLSVEELQNLLDAEFPHTFHRDGGYVIEEVWLGGSRVRKHFDQASLRPGGTIAGTTLMALTDIAISTTGDFGISTTTCTTSLAAKGKCTISVTFAPTQTGTRTGQLSVSDSASNSPQTSALKGTGK